MCFSVTTKMKTLAEAQAGPSTKPTTTNTIPPGRRRHDHSNRRHQLTICTGVVQATSFVRFLILRRIMATSSNSNIAQSVSMATKISHKSHPKTRPSSGSTISGRQNCTVLGTGVAPTATRGTAGAGASRSRALPHFQA